MKNIHVLPTDKPSRLHSGNLGLVLCDLKFNSDTINAQHIYITSDEEIKVNDYITDKYKVWQWKDDSSLLGRKKVILTTDLELQKDGVQKIDDEFLEWFVKNPSCERVEIKIEPMFPMYSTFIESIDNPPFYGNLKRKIIIPKEEPKFVTVNIESATGEDLGKVSYIPLPNLEYVPKQETLEEASTNYANKNFSTKDPVADEGWYASWLGFRNGAKWQQEQILQFLYSEITERRPYSSSKMCEKVIEFIEQLNTKK